MTTGEQILQKLNLDSKSDIKISNIYGTDFFIIWYNSQRPFPITKTTLNTFSNLEFWDNFRNKFLSFSPPMNLKTYNGMKNIPYILMDLAYNDKTSSKHKKESMIGKEPVVGYIGNLTELTVYDLKSQNNLSSVTGQYKKERNKIMGSGSKTIKLIDCLVEESTGDVTFQFLTEVTPYPAHPKDHEYMEADPNQNWALKRNSAKVYELQLKFLNVLDWIETYVEGEVITRKEMKEILSVADVQLSSTSPSWNWQGFAFWNTQLGTSIYKQNISPEVWDKVHGDGQAFLDKHLADLVFSIDFMLNPMSSMLTKKLKDRGLL